MSKASGLASAGVRVNFVGEQDRLAGGGWSCGGCLVVRCCRAAGRGAAEHPAAAGGPGRRGRSPRERPHRRDALPWPPRARRSGRSCVRVLARTARAASRPSAAAGEHRSRDLRRRRRGRAAGRLGRSGIHPAARTARSQAVPGLARAPACMSACAAARMRSACRAGSAVRATDHSRNAAAAAIPPRACARPAQRSSSVATSSSGPATAWAQCQTRRSG